MLVDMITLNREKGSYQVELYLYTTLIYLKYN